MAKRDGSSTIIKGARLICRAVEKYGTGGLTGNAPPEFIAAVLALHAACVVFKAMDDNPAFRDVTPGQAWDDLPPAGYSEGPGGGGGGTVQ